MDKSPVLVKCQDGSFTAYSSEFGEHYHSTKDGALQESLQKHVIPALHVNKHKSRLFILDICFGLGYNTLATLHYLHTNNISKHISIVSVEFDKKLINSLTEFKYPKAFDKYKQIITSLSMTGSYHDKGLDIQLHLVDARKYLLTCKEKFDIIYQDAFSPAVNPTLWTYEYFTQLYRLLAKDGVLTTYSISLPTRLALYKNGFHIYLLSHQNCRSSTLATITPLQGYNEVDMEHKISCNPQAEPLHDNAII